MSVHPLADRLESGFGLRWDDDRARHLGRFLGEERTSADIQSVLDALLIGETYFFRYPHYLQLLQARMASRPAGAPFRVACPACSTGEEPYSVCYALAEPAAAQGRRLEVVASDARRSAIDTARAAVYGAWSLRSVDAQARDRLLEPLPGARFAVREPWRSLPRFEVRNLLEPPAGGARFDAVLMPNATLYMGPGPAATVYHHVRQMLLPGGILLLAPTDPVPVAGWRADGALGGWAVFTPGEERPPTPAPPPPPPRPRPSRGKVVPFAAARARPDVAAPERRGEDEELWAAWANGRLEAAEDRVRELVFYEPDQPLWRFLHGALLWERGWLRRARKEMEAAARLLEPLPRSQGVRGVCTVAELTTLVQFWSEQHG